MMASMFPASSSPGRPASHRAGPGGDEGQAGGQVVQVLAGVADARDAGGAGVKRFGHAPDPGGAVAEDGDLAEVLAAAACVLGLRQAGEGVLAVEGGHAGGRARVHHRPAVCFPLAASLLLGILTPRRYLLGCRLDEHGHVPLPRQTQ